MKQARASLMDHAGTRRVLAAAALVAAALSTLVRIASAEPSPPPTTPVETTSPPAPAATSLPAGGDIASDPSVTNGASELPSVESDAATDVPPPSSDDAPPDPAAHGVVVVLGPAEHREKRAVRAARRLALLGEVGWNTLAGFGPNIVFHAHPHFSVEMGGGLSLEGWKLGLRARVNWLTAPVTPFVGVGGMMTTGLGQTLDISDSATGRTLNVRVLPSPYLQFVSGIDWTSANGFTMVGALGYAFLLRDNNVEIVAGEPTRDERRGLKIAFSSGLVISLAIGYTFK
jgi:hypothetical protein